MSKSYNPNTRKVAARAYKDGIAAANKRKESKIAAEKYWTKRIAASTDEVVYVDGKKYSSS